MSTSSNPWFTATVGLLCVIVGFAVGSRGSGTPAPAPSAPTPSPTAPAPVNNGPWPQGVTEVDISNVQKFDKKVDHYRGNPDGVISVLEYSDFDCPFCGRVHPTMAELVANNDNLHVAYRHFPLSIHPHAQKAGEAAECVAELGGNDKFWEFTDKYFEVRPQPTGFAALAASIGLDESEVQSCIDSGRHAERVKSDFAAGGRSGVRGTPGTVIVNNKTNKAVLVSGARPASVFQQTIDELLK